jgi:hypothetical protein
LFAVTLAAATVFSLGTQVASAATMSSQRAHFKALDGPFAKADSTFTNALTSITGNPSVAQVSKPSLAFVPALEKFDAGLPKCGFTGTGAKDAAAIVKLNTTEVAILSNIKSVKSFETQFSAISVKYEPLQTSLAKYLGLQAAYVTI